MKRKYIIYVLLAIISLAGCVSDIIDVIDTPIGDDDTELVNPALAWSASEAEAVLGSDNSLPTLTNKYNVSVSYSSSSASVATISEDGTVTPIAVGTTTITASSAADDTYESSSASYTLTVVKSEEGISWSETSCTVTVGAEDNVFPTLNNPGGQQISYSSSNPDVAEIDSEGNVSLVTEGTVSIIASSAESDTHEATSVYYTLTVLVEGSTLQDPGLSWDETYCEVVLASDLNTYPVLTAPVNLQISYSSSNPAVATIDSEGNVTLVGAGTTAITAGSAATEEYTAGSVSYTLKAVKNTVTIEWSQDSYSAILEEENSFPTLSLVPDGITVSFASSNTDVATISSDGAVSLKKAGRTTISATFAGNDFYKAASSTYELIVKSSADDGAVETSFDSAGDSSSDDDIANTSFTRLVTVTYSGSGASVSGYSAVSDLFTVTTSGNKVEITYTGSENVVYKLSGSASDGYFKLYSSKKQAIWLAGLDLTCTSGAAINNQSGKRTFVYVEGTNTLSDASSASYSAVGDEDMKGVFFSEGQLVFSGSGSLTVNAKNSQSKSGIVSDDYVRFMKSPKVTVTCGSSAGHGVKVNEYVQLSNGTLNITTNAAMKKGITSDDYVLVEGGTTTITVNGGVAKDDDGEYTGTAGIKADNYFGMTGGVVNITNKGNGGKGLRAGDYDYYYANKSLTDSYVSGGTLTITTSGSESNDVSAKGIKIGYKETDSSSKAGWGGNATSYIYGGNMTVSGGKINVTCSKSEGFEVKGTLTFNGGETYVYSSGDDAINSQGELNLNGGYVYCYSTANDAIDTNSDLKLNGGYLYAICTAGNPEVAVDANTEGGYKLYINSGATVVAYGGLESGYSASQTVYSFSATAGSWNALYDGSKFIAAFKAPSGISTFAVSAPSLSKGYKGVTVSSSSQLCNGTWAVSGISGGTSTDLGTYSGGGGFGPGGGGPGGGGPWH